MTSETRSNKTILCETTMIGSMQVDDLNQDDSGIQMTSTIEPLDRRTSVTFWHAPCTSLPGRCGRDRVVEWLPDIGWRTGE